MRNPVLADKHIVKLGAGEAGKIFGEGKYLSMLT